MIGSPSTSLFIELVGNSSHQKHHREALEHVPSLASLALGSELSHISVTGLVHGVLAFKMVVLVSALSGSLSDPATPSAVPTKK